MTEALNPKTVATQAAMLRLLSTPPEPILSMFERLGIPWQRINKGQEIPIEDEAVFVVKWSDLVAGETANQQAGPFVKKLVEELKVELAEQTNRAAHQAAVEKSLGEQANSGQPDKYGITLDTAIPKEETDE